LCCRKYQPGADFRMIFLASKVGLLTTEGPRYPAPFLNGGDKMVRLLALTAALGFPAVTWGAGKAAATPEELVKLLGAVEKADGQTEVGTFKALLPLYGGPNRPLFEDALKVMEAGEALDKALEKKFGKDPNYRPIFALPSEPAKRVELKGKRDLGGGKVELTIWTTTRDFVLESREVAVKENGGWVLEAGVPFVSTTSTEEKRTVDGREITVQVMSPPRLTPDTIEAAHTALPKMRILLELAAKDVARGKYESRMASVSAVEKAIEEVMTAAAGKKGPR